MTFRRTVRDGHLAALPAALSFRGVHGVRRRLVTAMCTRCCLACSPSAGHGRVTSRRTPVNVNCEEGQYPGYRPSRSSSIISTTRFWSTNHHHCQTWADSAASTSTPLRYWASVSRGWLTDPSPPPCHGTSAILHQLYRRGKSLRPIPALSVISRRASMS